MAKKTNKANVLIIPGIYTKDVGFSFDHCSTFQLTVDGVLMTRANLRTYFSNERTMPKAAVLRERSEAQVYRQIYFSGIYLYNFLRKAGYNTSLLNCFIAGSNETSKALKAPIDVIVVSTTFIWCKQLRPVIKHIREMLPNVKIIVGGRWVYDSYRILQKHEKNPELFPPEVLKRYFFTDETAWDDIDLFIVGEHGENILDSILDSISRKEPFKNFPNCAYWNDGELLFTERTEETFDVSNLAIDWGALPEKYHSSVMPIVAGIGCPFKCKFCDYSLSKLYYKSFDMLREELHQLEACRFVSTAWFIDDNFLYNTKRILEFTSMWKEENFNLNWYGIIRMDSITKETAKALADTGLKMVMLGVESGSEKILSNMNKKATLEQYRKGFKLLAANGIRAKILLVIGFPGEDSDTIQETIDFLNEIPGKPDIGHEIFLSPFCVLPLAHLNTTEDRRAFGLEGYIFDWRHESMEYAEVYDAMKRIYLETEGVFQYYPDNDFDFLEGSEREEMLEIALTREQLRKAQLSGASAERQDALWNQLEKLVMGES
jgi:radical SAM superfamily enzyme YgiQ (UPF0313 family)